ncbi:MAG: M67 family metallopeptidase [Oxalobacter sp.]|nr:M67 family metallopeptidase [Oxalobacter sp.]
MIVMTEEQKRAIDAHGEETYPNECCGIMLGEVLDDGTKVLEELLPVDNSREDGEQYHRFEIKAEDLLEAEKVAASRHLDVVGFYHSHPDHPSVPSEYDRSHAFLFYSYIIVAVEKGRAGAFTSWELDKDFQFESEKLTIKE